MKTFHYRRAWHEAAKPAYLALPQDVRDLLAYTATAAAELHQLRDCSMPWPEAGSPHADLRDRFAAVPAEVLALAAQVIYNVGHWYPSTGDLQVPGRELGAHWKFSHYADQSLRERFNIRGTDDPGVTVRCLEGALRLCYSSRHSWTWQEVAPATEAGLTYARGLATRLNVRLSGIHRGHISKRDSAAWTFMESLKGDRAGYPPEWLPLVDTERYMVEETELIAQDQKLSPKDPAKLRRELQARTVKKIAELQAEEAGYLWLIDRGLDTENVIYYAHTGRFCVGWRVPLTPAAISQWLDVMTEFPYEYDVKGYTPEVVAVMQAVQS